MDTEDAELAKETDIENAEIVIETNTKDTELVKETNTKDAELVKETDTEDAELVKETDTEDAEIVKETDSEDAELVKGNHKSHHPIVLVGSDEEKLFDFHSFKSCGRFRKMTTAKLGIHEHLPLDDSIDESSDEALKPDFSSDESADGNYVPDSYSGSECASDSDDSRHVRNKRPHKRAYKSDSPIIHAKKRKSNVNTSKENYVADRHGGSSDDVVREIAGDVNETHMNSSTVNRIETSDYDSDESDQIEENKIIRDEEYRGIYITKLQTSDKSIFGKAKKHSRVHDFYHACVYCHKLFSNITNHLRNKHKQNSEVKRIIDLGVGEHTRKTRRRLWDILRNRGDHLHNMEVLKRKNGRAILSRRPSVFKFASFGPCPNCLEWIQLDRTLDKHKPLCPGVEDTAGMIPKTTPTRNESIMQSLVISNRIGTLASAALKNEVFTIMTRDEVSGVAQKDDLIVLFGNTWMKKNCGNKMKRKYYTSSRMR